MERRTAQRTSAQLLAIQIGLVWVSYSYAYNRDTEQLSTDKFDTALVQRPMVDMHVSYLDELNTLILVCAEN